MWAGSFLGQRNVEMTLRSTLNKKSILLIFLPTAEFWRHGNLQEWGNGSGALWISWGLLGFGSRGKLGSYHLTPSLPSRHVFLSNWFSKFNTQGVIFLQIHRPPWSLSDSTVFLQLWSIKVSTPKAVFLKAPIPEIPAIATR